MALLRHRAAPPISRPGCRPMRADCSLDLQHHREPPGNVVERLHLGELDAPVAAHVDLGDGAAPALVFVVAHESVGERLARDQLHLGIERRAHREAAFVQLLLAVALVDFAADFLGEILGREHVRAGRARGDVERLLLGRLRLRRLDVAVLDHAIDHVVAPLDRALALAERMQRARRLRQRGEIGGFRDRQLVHRLVVVDQRGRGDAVGAEAEIDLVEIELEDLVLGVGALDPQREQRFLDLAVERDLVGQQEVLGDLLRDRGSALRPATRAHVLQVDRSRRARCRRSRGRHARRNSCPRPRGTR